MFKIALRQAFPILINDVQGERYSLRQKRELELAVEITGEQLNEIGMLYDFFDLKLAVQSIVERFCREKVEQNSHAELLEYLKVSLQTDLPHGLKVENLAIVVAKGCELALS